MKVKLKEYDSIMDVAQGYIFEVLNQDDGFFTDHPFYQGWVQDSNGHKMYIGYEQNQCEVVEW